MRTGIMYEAKIYEDGLPPIRDVIGEYGLDARKSLGQNFLTDLNLTGKIARIADGLGGTPLKGSIVYEVGPGPGALTRALLMAGVEKVVAVEMDPRCIMALQQVQAAYPGRLEVIEGDARQMDEQELIGDTRGHAVKIIANLPYNIGTALLVKWLCEKTWLPWYSSLTLMFQKEVGARITARPRTKAYGRLSILSQYRASAKTAFDVPARAFTPPPRVTSSIIAIAPQQEPDGCPDQNILERVVYAAFNQRRKMLRSSLKALGKDPLPYLRAAGIEGTCRAEELTIDDFCRLARSYQQ